MATSTLETRKQRMYRAIDRLQGVLKRLESAHWEYLTAAKPLEEYDDLSSISYDMKTWPIPDPDEVLMRAIKKLQQTKEEA